MIPHKGISIHTTVEAAAAGAGGLPVWQSLANSNPNGHFEKPPPPSKSNNVRSSFEGAAEGGPPGPQCNRHVPSCPHSRQAEKEHEVEENDKAMLKRKNQISINA